ncbi:MAG: 2-oxo acid dehydrogenase subunit E2 [Clostridiales bacterium]|nr:2-oxo acid dehydrogenase subunit E2 [Clostridiales bacterium]
MATEIIMPKAGMAMEKGTIVRWLKEIGDPIESGEAIMEIETDKITMETEADAAGVLLAKFYDDGAVVPVTTIIGYIGKPDEKVPDAHSAVQAADSAVPVTAGDAGDAGDAGAAGDAGTAGAVSAAGVAMSVGESQMASGPAEHSDRIRATPYAKTLAAQKNIDIASVPGSGAGGVIKACDVERAVKATPLAARVAADLGIDLATVEGTGFGGKVTRSDLPAASPVVSASPAASDLKAPLAGIRKTVARRMLQSHLEIPPVTQTMKAYVDDLLPLRDKINKNREQRITINDMIVMACAKAVMKFPQIRTEIDTQAGQLITRSQANIGVAVSLEQGLIVPVLRDADKLSLSDISSGMKDLAGRARSGNLRPDEYSGSTFTVSNMGALGIQEFTPIINQPNAAIMGVGCINDELALADGQVVSRKYLMLSLTFDHRIIDGADAAVFQGYVKNLLENPLDMLV